MVEVNTRKIMMFEARKKSVGAAFVLWVFTGGLGGHRLYVGKIWTALILLGLTVLGFAGLMPILLLVGLWLIIDAFRIPGWIRAANIALADEVSGAKSAALMAGIKPPPLPKDRWKHPVHNAKDVRWRDVGVLLLLFAALVAAMVAAGGGPKPG